MLIGASTYDDLRGYFFLSPECRKDPSLGTHFANLRALPDGCFELELGVALPDLFPNVDGQPEYVLEVSDGGQRRTVCFSNVMARLRYEKAGRSLHALVPRLAVAHVRAGQIEFVPKDASVELLRTFAGCRFRILGATAEEAFETHCESCIHELIEVLNICLKALPFVDEAPGRLYSNAYSRASLPSFYFFIRGEADDEFGHGWISAHIGRASLNPATLNDSQSGVLRALVTGEQSMDDIDALMHSAQSFLDGGIVEYVLLLIVIAGEVATQRYVTKRLKAASVSANKLDEYEKDLTYSMMLNVVLVALTPDDRKPDRELLGRMNRARSLRNDYMHNGALPDDPKEIASLFVGTKEFISYLREVDL